MAYTEEDLEIAIGANNVGAAIEIQLQGIFNLVKRAGDSSKLQIACQNQAEDMVDLILAQPGIYLDYQNASGNSALHDAVRQNHPGIVTKLFKAGASLNLRTADRGETPLLMLLRMTIEKNQPQEEVEVKEKDGFKFMIKKDENIDDQLMQAIKASLAPDDMEQAIKNSLAGPEEEKPKVNYPLFDLLIDHPETDLTITSFDPREGGDLNLLDYLVDSKCEDHQLMEYLLTKLLNKKVNLDMVSTYQKMLASPSCDCGGAHHNNELGSIFYLEDFLRVGYLPDMEGQKFFFWIIKKIKDHPKREEILKLVNQYVDRTNLYQENPNPESCSILEVLLENLDLETIKKLHKETPLAVDRVCRQHGQTPLQHWLETLPPNPLSIPTFSEVYQLMIEGLGGKWPTTRPETDQERTQREANFKLIQEQLDDQLMILLTDTQTPDSSDPVRDFRRYLLEMAEYYQFDVKSEEMGNQFRAHLLNMGASAEQMDNLLSEFLRLIQELVIPHRGNFYPDQKSAGTRVYHWWKARLFQHPDNQPIFQFLVNHHRIGFDSHLTRAEKVIAIRMHVRPHLIKTLLLKLKQDNSDLIINQDEMITHEPIETIPDNDLVIMTNGVVWDQNNLIGYILHNTKGINKFDQHIPHESLRGQPIWSQRDFEQIFQVRADRHDDISSEYRRLVDYLNFSKYSKNFTAVEKESLRRFTSIFWARGGWWNLEIKKILSPDHLKEWEEVKNRISGSGMPSTSAELGHHLANLKARFLHLYRDFYDGLSKETKEAMVKLHSRLTENYSQLTIDGNECIMCYGQVLAKLLTKLDLDLNLCQPQILRENQEFESNEEGQDEIGSFDESEEYSEDSDGEYSKTPLSVMTSKDTYQEDYESELPHLLDHIPYDSYYN